MDYWYTGLTLWESFGVDTPSVWGWPPAVSPDGSGAKESEKNMWDPSHLFQPKESKPVYTIYGYSETVKSRLFEGPPPQSPNNLS